MGLSYETGKPLVRRILQKNGRVFDSSKRKTFDIPSVSNLPYRIYQRAFLPFETRSIPFREYAALRGAVSAPLRRLQARTSPSPARGRFSSRYFCSTTAAATPRASGAPPPPVPPTSPPPREGDSDRFPLRAGRRYKPLTERSTQTKPANSATQPISPSSATPAPRTATPWTLLALFRSPNRHSPVRWVHPERKESPT